MPEAHGVNRDLGNFIVNFMAAAASPLMCGARQPAALPPMHGEQRCILFVRPLPQSGQVPAKKAAAAPREGRVPSILSDVIRTLASLCRHGDLAFCRCLCRIQ